MNNEIAGRLLQYRKKLGLSQEELAERIGVSRQAVSKWERGEASPDTDNLIELSRIYGVSLDEMLLGITAADSAKNPEDSSDDENGGEKKIYTDDDGNIQKSADVIAEHGEHKRFHGNFWMKLPFPVLVAAAYLAFGIFDVMGGWAFGWIVFLFIPLYYTFVEAILKHNAKIFAYPVLVVVIYLVCGFVWNLWHPMWLIFLTIPIYYWLVGMIRHE